MAPRSLTAYRIREHIGGETVTHFDQAISQDHLDSRNLATYELEDEFDFEATLYVWLPSRSEPAWVDFLRQGFQGLELVETALNCAVLMVRIDYYRKDRYFAFTFGAGRHALKPSAYQRNFGLRTALNVIYRGDDSTSPAPASIRRVDAKTVAENTFRTRRQSNRLTSFAAFGVDVRQDLLGAVTGVPAEEEWGTRIGGSDPVYLNLEVTFSELGRLCRRLWRTERFEDYRARFDWIDNIEVVQDRDLVDWLEARVLRGLRTGSLDEMELAPPELVDWDTVDHFRFSPNRDATFPDLRLGDYLATLEEAGKRDGLNLNMLKRSHRVEALAGDGAVLEAWPVFRCLDGEVADLTGTCYLLVEGDFFKVSPEYLAELDREIEHLAESEVYLPDSPRDDDDKELTEGAYNELAAQSSEDLLLLDKKTIKVATHTSPIEICDLLSTDRQLIHVKRKLGSSSLSHLFAQGSVSADLLLMSEEFRTRAREKVEEAEEARAREEGNPEFEGKFSPIIDDLDPARFEVVYAIVAAWNGRELVQALPFFSKVNLRRHVNDLRRMGYWVTYRCVSVV